MITVQPFLRSQSETVFTSVRPVMNLAPEKHALEMLRAIYADAIREGYRFYRYGDAMLIV